MTDRYEKSQLRSPRESKGPPDLGIKHTKAPTTTSLPYNARQLGRHDLTRYRPMFAFYLDIQKQIHIDELDDREIKGRWKSFMNKWNRGELSEGWYDPDTLSTALKSQNGGQESQFDNSATRYKDLHNRSEPQFGESGQSILVYGLDSEDTKEDFGPLPPSTLNATQTIVPTSVTQTLEDIRTRVDDLRERNDQAYRNGRARSKRDFKAEAKLTAARLDELAPRADPGTRERQLEKKRDLAASNRAFIEDRDAGQVDVPEVDAMGGGGDEELLRLKRIKAERERYRSEREVKKDEILQARKVEREERGKRMREREDKTMDMLRNLARERFGDGNEQESTLRERK